MNSGQSRVGLVGCVKQKAHQPAPARELYTSTLFRGRKAFVAETCDTWFILSAKYGLVAPDEVLEPYDESLTDMTATARRAWAQRVLLQVDAVGLTLTETTFEIHAGASYRNFGLTAGLQAEGAAVEIVAEHLGQGEQLAFYSNSRSERSHHSGRPRTVQQRSKQAVDRDNNAYSPLGEYLSGNSGQALALSFTELEDVLGRPLPASARRHRAWWANDSSGTHSHARAWMDAGWIVDGVDLRTELVRLRRESR